ncbi:MAG: hypothetical protein R3E79_36500 [Caldilineaceae bacterium]
MISGLNWFDDELTNALRRPLLFKEHQQQELLLRWCWRPWPALTLNRRFHFGYITTTPKPGLGAYQLLLIHCGKCAGRAGGLTPMLSAALENIVGACKG